MAKTKAWYLDVGEVDAVEVTEHLRDLSGVLQDGASRLSQVIERRVASQGLGERSRTHHLKVSTVLP